MRGYIIIPKSVSCNLCMHCGARPIIALAEKGEYVVKCPNDNTHYQTIPGLIDIDDWNMHNQLADINEFGHITTIAC
jgi:hypothetical protein